MEKSVQKDFIYKKSGNRNVHKEYAIWYTCENVPFFQKENAMMGGVGVCVGGGGTRVSERLLFDANSDFLSSSNGRISLTQ
jgi:hypothetical protein